MESPTEANRPHVFVKELRLYTGYLRRVIAGEFGTDRAPEAVAAFRQNLAAGVRYYLKRLEERGLGPWKDELESFAAQNVRVYAWIRLLFFRKF